MTSDICEKRFSKYKCTAGCRLCKSLSRIHQGTIRYWKAVIFIDYLLIFVLICQQKNPQSSLYKWIGEILQCKTIIVAGIRIRIQRSEEFIQGILPECSKQIFRSSLECVSWIMGAHPVKHPIKYLLSFFCLFA